MAEPEAKLGYDARGNPVLWELNDPTCNFKEALGLLKDWVSTLLALQASIVAAVAALVGVHAPENFEHFSYFQTAVAGVAALSALVSIVSGLFLLNMLPAAAQRQPSAWLKEHPEDLFSITTQATKWWDPTAGRSILCWTRWFRFSFLAMITFMVIFVALRLWPVLFR